MDEQIHLDHIILDAALGTIHTVAYFGIWLEHPTTTGYGFLALAAACAAALHWENTLHAFRNRTKK